MKTKPQNDFEFKLLNHQNVFYDMVIYKDDNVLVLNKPSGIAVQGGTNTSFHIDGLLDALMFEKESVQS